MDSSDQGGPGVSIWEGRFESPFYTVQLRGGPTTHPGSLPAAPGSRLGDALGRDPLASRLLQPVSEVFT